MIADTSVAAVLAATALPVPFLAGRSFRSGDALAVIIVLAETVPLIWRRSHPDIVLAAIGAATLVYYAAGYGSQPAWPALVVAFYSFGAHRRNWAQLWAVAALGAEMAASFLTHPHHSSGVAFVGVSPGAWVAFPVAWAAGHILGTRRAEAARLFQRAERAEAEREANALQAVAQERARIARELHDIVAHALGVIVMQAGGAARVPDLDPALAKEVLGSIEQSGRQAFAEMRRLLDVLRDDQRPAERAPQPKIADLTALVARFSDAGLAVTMEVEGRATDAGAGIELSAYRIVQEALTNALKHAGPVPAQLRLIWSDRDLKIEVLNETPTGIVHHAGPPDSGGHGLVGMRERVALFGGDLWAGPLAAGGFAVRARIPLPSPSALAATPTVLTP